MYKIEIVMSVRGGGGWFSFVTQDCYQIPLIILDNLKRFLSTKLNDVLAFLILKATVRFLTYCQLGLSPSFSNLMSKVGPKLEDNLNLLANGR